MVFEWSSTLSRPKLNTCPCGECQFAGSVGCRSDRSWYSQTFPFFLSGASFVSAVLVFELMFFEPSDFHARRVTIWKCLPIAQRVDAVAPSTVSHAHFATVMRAVVLSDIFILWSLNGAPLYLATCFIRLSSVNAVRPYDVHRVS